MKKSILSTLFTVLALSQLTAQDNFFFPLHNIIRGDSVYNTFDKQVELIKNAGYDGIEINQVESFEGMKKALDDHRFPGAYFYVKIALEEPYFDPRLKECIQKLKGSKVIVSPYIISESRTYKPSSRAADELVVKLVTELAGWAKASGLQVAIYPHINYYVERADHALDLAKKVNLKNVGLTFNLCHWLASTTAEERKNLKIDLAEMAPYLKMITVNGANDIISTRKNRWDDYILPLGMGTFDTYGLLKYVLNDLKFKGPVGVQCYDIKGNKPALVRQTISTWKSYTARLKSEK